ncbi:hypothetical protein FA13DRAFT_1709682 [Coprinellus micaceus]|uniref:Uncharacterized protein n=1 Tax=Coprinellus micaceus TaxID=71717 RepID=A0A4Y7TAM5_COPMI|nr:hypothetical protein FA13DRAFT_1709682 [Coprinellus micaceus]
MLHEPFDRWLTWGRIQNIDNSTCPRVGHVVAHQGGIFYVIQPVRAETSSLEHGAPLVGVHRIRRDFRPGKAVRKGSDPNEEPLSAELSLQFNHCSGSVHFFVAERARAEREYDEDVVLLVKRKPFLSALQGETFSFPFLVGVRDDGGDSPKYTCRLGMKDIHPKAVDQGLGLLKSGQLTTRAGSMTLYEHVPVDAAVVGGSITHEYPSHSSRSLQKLLARSVFGYRNALGPQSRTKIALGHSYLDTDKAPTADRKPNKARCIGSHKTAY